MGFLGRFKGDMMRENNREYLVISVNDSEGDYTERMIARNRIEGLLPFSRREMNGEIFYYYDITGKKVFSGMFDSENDMMERTDVERICSSLCLLSDSLKEYLLDEDHVIIGPESMFYNSDKQIYEFLYVPGDVKTILSISAADLSGSDEKGSGVLCEDIKVYHGEVEDSGEEIYDFRHGVRCVWDRVMEKFDHQSGIEDLKRVYEIHQKVYSDSFDPGEVFAVKQGNSIQTSKKDAIDGSFKEKESEEDRFSRESLKNSIKGSWSETDVKNRFTDDNTGDSNIVRTEEEKNNTKIEKAGFFWRKEENEEEKTKDKTETLGEKIMAFDLKTYLGDLSKKFFSGKGVKKDLLKKAPLG